jgi:hypothetical protein
MKIDEGLSSCANKGLHVMGREFEPIRAFFPTGLHVLSRGRQNCAWCEKFVPECFFLNPKRHSGSILNVLSSVGKMFLDKNKIQYKIFRQLL